MKGTEGNRIDYDVVGADIVALLDKYDLREIQYDRWNAVQLAGQLEGAGLQMLPMTQSFNTFDDPSRYLEKLVAEKKLLHNAHPVLRWMARNVAIVQNADGKIRPHKMKSAEKIDGIVALIMAIDRARRFMELHSAYEERGIVVI